jgi:HTH-type transcriptional regulator/antitoxin HipB
MPHTAALPVRSSDQIGAQLRRLRKEQGLTQADLAAKSGLRPELISRIEQGHPGVHLEAIFALLAALNHEMILQPRSRSSPSDIADIF